MQLKCLALFALCIQAHAALTPKEVINSVHNITELSIDTLDVVKNLDPANLTTDGLKTVANIRQIADTANDTAKVIEASDGSHFAKVDQLDICTAFASFMQAVQKLLQALVDQKGILSDAPLSMVLAPALHFLKTGIDKLASQIIGIVPTCADEAKKDLKEFDAMSKIVYAAYPIKLHLPGMIGVPLETGVEHQ
ncbi:hypothetical protein V8C35DRAFT_326012 [Trichoderma chlorosporum]